MKQCVSNIHSWYKKGTFERLTWLFQLRFGKWKFRFESLKLKKQTNPKLTLCKCYIHTVSCVISAQKIKAWISEHVPPNNKLHSEIVHSRYALKSLQRFRSVLKLSESGFQTSFSQRTDKNGTKKSSKHSNHPDTGAIVAASTTPIQEVNTFLNKCFDVFVLYHRYGPSLSWLHVTQPF